MNNNIMKKRLLSLAVISAFAQANDQSTTTNDVSGFYLGGGFGVTTADDNSTFFDLNLDSNDNAYKLIAGYQINRIVGIETQYTRYGDIYSKNTDPRIYATPENFSVMANLGYTFDSGWRPFGTIGFGKTKIKSSISSDNETSFHVGVGGEYSPNELKNLSLRVAYEVDGFTQEVQGNYGYYGVREDVTVTIGTFYVGASYKF